MPQVDLWLWVPPMDREVGTLDTIQALTQAGYRRMTPASPQTFALLAQLRHFILLRIPGRSELEQWAHAGDIAATEETPVALAFKLPEHARQILPTIPDTLPIAVPLPPPQFGEYALIDNGKEWIPYTLSAVGSDGLDLWRRMGEKLKTLAAPAEWWLYTNLTVICSQVGGYEQARSALNSRLLATRGEEREQVRSQLQALDAARKQVRAIELSRKRARENGEEWRAGWEEAQQMAQQLAALYWKAHQAAYHPAEPDTVPQTEQHQRAPRAPRAALVIKDPPAVPVPSNIFAQGIMRSLLDGNEYTRYPDRGIAEYHRTLAKRKGEITITLEPGDGEGWDHVMDSLNALGDEIADTFCAHLALAIDTHGVENITAPMWVNTDDILRICQRKQSNRAYTPEQRAAVVEHQRIIARAHVHASWPSGRKGREYRIDSAIWDVFGQAVGEYKTVTGEPVWERRQVKIGEWAKLLPPLSKETAIMLRRVLEYHSQRDRYAKRLGRFLTLQFRVNASRGGTVERTMCVLLEQAGIKPDLKNPGRTREMIEGALARLKADSVIGDYRQIVDSTPKGQEVCEQIEQRARGWWDLYAGQLWQIDSPEHVREQYRRLLREPDAEG